MAGYLRGPTFLDCSPVGGTVATRIQEDITAAAVAKSSRDSTEEAAFASGRDYTSAEEAARDAAAKAVSAGGKAAGLTPAEYEVYQGSASASTAGAHSVGRDLAQVNRP